ncbi:MAG TPA: histidine triad nucleotide-binding protein [Rickettsiales bacterium]|nr:histidine triad nucleotide-binding protein [Rickettsiales bacterium]
MQKKYDENNIFQKIIKKELPSTIIYEDDKVLAFNDINPKAPVHILVIPKANYISFDDFVEHSTNEEVAYFFKKVQEIAKNQGLSEKSYRIVGNCGEEAGQIVHHFHIHILGYK